jgi:hypothetical protein
MEQDFFENEDYYFEQEKAWRKSLPKYSDKELISIFPEVKEIIPQKIREWKVVLKKEKDKLKECLVSIYSQKLDEFSIWFGELAARLLLMSPIMEAEKNILRLKRMQSIFSQRNGKLERWQEKLEKARQYPITELAESELDFRQSSKNLTALCPFHNEKNPSFYIYPETNTFHCFGCQEHGDVIKLTQHLYGLDFKEAVRMLQD